MALGAKARLSDHVETGFAWEMPLSGRQDLLFSQRLLVELILRY